MSKSNVATIPRVGSDEFRALDFREQLEIKALQLFDPVKYKVLIGESEEQRPVFRLPESHSLVPTSVDLPVTISRNCWAAYHCDYNPKRYGPISPIETFDVSHERQMGVHLFTFPLLCVDTIIQRFIMFLSNTSKRVRNIELITEACAMYVAYVGSAFEGQLPLSSFALKTIRRSSKELCLPTIESINGYYPMVEECEEVTYMKWSILLILQKSRVYNGRVFYPLVPIDLYEAKFSIFGWSFLNC